MSLSPIAFFGLLDENNPVGTDSRTISDDQHRNILASMKQQAPNWTGAITATHQDMNLLTGYVAAGQRIMPGIGGSTVCFFYNDTPPTGWLINEIDTKQLFLAIAPVQPAVPGVYGADPCTTLELPTTVINVSVDLPANTGGHALTEAENGPHDHPMQVNTNDANLGSPVLNYLAAGGTIDLYRSGTNAVNNVMIGSSGSGTAHSHPLGGTATQTAGSGSGSTTAFDPKRAIGVLGRLQT